MSLPQPLIMHTDSHSRNYLVVCTTLTGLRFITTNDVILLYFRFVLVMQSHTKEQTSLLFGLQGLIAGHGVRCMCQQGGRCHDLMLKPKLRLLSSVPICLGTSAEKQG